MAYLYLFIALSCSLASRSCKQISSAVFCGALAQLSRGISNRLKENGWLSNVAQLASVWRGAIMALLGGVMAETARKWRKWR